MFIPIPIFIVDDFSNYSFIYFDVLWRKVFVLNMLQLSCTVVRVISADLQHNVVQMPHAAVTQYPNSSDDNLCHERAKLDLSLTGLLLGQLLTILCATWQQPSKALQGGSLRSLPKSFLTLRQS